MLKEILEYLNPRSGQSFIDCTLGGAGYAVEIARRVGDKGKVLAIDLDEMAIKNAESLISKFGLNNIILANDNFKNLREIIKKYFGQEKMIGSFAGIVFDLGLSSAQLEDSYRGFSFQLDSPLDMAFHSKIDDNSSTKEIVNNWNEKKLEKIIREYGEEKFANRIAVAIGKERKNRIIKTTGELVEIIKKAVPKKYLLGKIHPATRTFQALRIATNNELDNLREVLPITVDLLKSGGRLAIVSFHSLEDRIVKNFFRQESRDCLCPSVFPVCRCGHKAKLKIITKKIITPDAQEKEKNFRSRSAKLRVAEKI